MGLTIILLLVVVLIIVFSIISQSRRSYVENTSAILEQIRILENSLNLKCSYSPNITRTISFNTKRKLDAYTGKEIYESNKDYCISQIRRREEYNYKVVEFAQRIADITEVVSTDDEVILKGKMDPKKYLAIQKDFVLDYLKRYQPNTTPLTLHIHATYTSPQGRNHWYKDLYYNENQFSVGPVTLPPYDYVIPEKFYFNSLLKKKETSNLLSTKVVDSFEYIVSTNGTAKVTKHLYQEQNVLIPRSITYNHEEILVTSYNPDLFKNDTTLNTITIEAPFTKIEDETFYGCSNLHAFYYPNTVTSFGNRAFHGCDLNQFIVSDSVAIIGDSCFSCNKNLESIIITKNTKQIMSNAFWLDGNLTIYLEDTTMQYEKDWNSEEHPVLKWEVI